MTSSLLTFGIYPLSPAGTPTGLAVGPEDDYAKIADALRELRGDSRALSPRNYLVFTKPDSEPGLFKFADRLLHGGLLGDLTIGWHQMGEADIGMEAWLAFVRQVVRTYGSHLSSLQITNEPNLSFMEGAKPYARQALIAGVIAAKQEMSSLGLQVPIGFGSVPESPVSVPGFWEGLAEEGGKTFADSVDFVGHNFYVDVFEEEPLDLNEIPAAVERTLRQLREDHLTAAGISASVPIRVTENGWPTGQNPFTLWERSYERQASVLEAVIRAVFGLREELHISHYELFGLRDADSGKQDLFHQYGILRDDYTPKPAFEVFKRLIRELGR
ncbi:hypothetical protein [Cohnella zeiphila]|uniref:Glycoside hydrolase family 5 domain-containing protein n=1 Tax=Cohnella zeiphila TaxID=2761120 RepID=A0A7X0SJV5_9BACL|nr:hypothetical protein [Cohnella zeiphila]MBB6731201.1 hypothetical protein [Cohnella zeiphila]